MIARRPNNSLEPTALRAAAQLGAVRHREIKLAGGAVMLMKEQIMRLLREHYPFLAAEYGVKKVGVFWVLC